MASPVGNLLVRIGADVGGLRKGGRRAETSLQKIGRQARDTAKRMAKLGAAAIAAGAAITANLTRKGLASVDAQAKLARALQGTVDGLRAVQLAASDAGVDNMAESLNRMNRRLGAAERGSAEYADAVEDLGLNLQKLQDMDVHERVATIADAVRDAGRSSQETARLIQKLGFEQAEANAFFRQGGDAIRAAREEVDELGLSISQVDAAKVERANDAMARIGASLEGIQNQLAIELAPVLEGMANAFVEAQKETGGLKDMVGEFVDRSIHGIAAVADGVDVIRRGFLLANLAGGQAFLELQRGALELANVINEKVLSGLQTTVNVLRAMTPGMMILDFTIKGIDPEKTREQLESSRVAVEEGRARIAEVLAQPLPSAGILQWVDGMREGFEMAEHSTIEARERLTEVNLVADERERERRRQQLATMREVLGEHFGIEADIVQRGRKKMMDINTSFDEAETESKKRHARIRWQVTGDILSRISNLMDAESKKQFRIQQLANIGQSIMSTWTGMSRALELGWPMGPIAAGIIGGLGFANVAKIASRSFQGGGTGGSAPSGAPSLGGGGGGSSTPPPPTSQGGQFGGPNTLIQLEGDVFGREQIRSLIERINEEGRNGGRITVA